MLQACLTALVLLPALCAQTPPTDPVPIKVTGSVSALDTQVWRGFPEGPGLFMTVQNVSGRGIQGYAYETTFTDPASGERVEHITHSTYRQPSLGVALAPGGKQDVARPYPMRIAAYGVPAKVSFDVDLVVFEDGTTWGPGKTKAAKQLLLRVQGMAPKRR
jgi:hypothetical protein